MGDNGEVIKKKRGRKPKVKNDIENQNTDNTSSSISIEINSNTETDIVKLPKKRGRKPKGGKIIDNALPDKPTVSQNPNIILHLKCKTSELNKPNTLFNANIDSFQFETSKVSDLNYDVIANSSIVNNGEDKPICDNNSNTNSNTNSNNNNFLPCDDEYKNICFKLKQLSYNLQTNNIVDKQSNCFWCSYSFDNPTIYIPKYQLNNTYHCYGCFCSPECATAFLFKESIDTSTRFERYYLLNNIYNKIYNYSKNIKPAPNPFYTLDKYYGSLTIQEYRRLFNKERFILVIDKPLSRILPELVECNDDIILNNSINQGKYKIKKKTKQNKLDILNDTFNKK